MGRLIYCGSQCYGNCELSVQKINLIPGITKQ